LAIASRNSFDGDFKPDFKDCQGNTKETSKSKIQQNFQISHFHRAQLCRGDDGQDASEPAGKLPALHGWSWDFEVSFLVWAPHDDSLVAPWRTFMKK
jgi:hypothetical protein